MPKIIIPKSDQYTITQEMFKIPVTMNGKRGWRRDLYVEIKANDVPNLKRICKHIGVKKYSTMTRPQLINAIMQNIEFEE
jgi:hypothetical protein